MDETEHLGLVKMDLLEDLWDERVTFADSWMVLCYGRAMILAYAAEIGRASCRERVCMLV